MYQEDGPPCESKWATSFPWVTSCLELGILSWITPGSLLPGCEASVFLSDEDISCGILIALLRGRMLVEDDAVTPFVMAAHFICHPFT